MYGPLSMQARKMLRNALKDNSWDQSIGVAGAAV